MEYTKQELGKLLREMKKIRESLPQPVSKSIDEVIQQRIDAFEEMYDSLPDGPIHDHGEKRYRLP